MSSKSADARSFGGAEGTSTHWCYIHNGSCLLVYHSKYSQISSHVFLDAINIGLAYDSVGFEIDLYNILQTLSFENVPFVNIDHLLTVGFRHLISVS